MYQPQISFSTTVASFAAAIFLFIVVMVDSIPVEARSPSAVSPAAAATDMLSPPRAKPLQYLQQHAAHIKDGDEIAVLRAIDVALTEAGDGATYVWKRDEGRLNGAIRMTTTFRDGTGRICRHMELMLNTGIYTRRTEGIACRSVDGVWVLEG